eukprot:3795153-Lingulodinium_polyedra.AAC.1
MQQWGRVAAAGARLPWSSSRCVVPARHTGRRTGRASRPHHPERHAASGQRTSSQIMAKKNEILKGSVRMSQTGE